ncbi:MAG TPA: M3 family metallopeptidase [Candidatus Eremiobacteraceae bacterium]|nr:M3 family metallopeptidase [Candidatus Eremiobacteraceae bacterium]
MNNIALISSVLLLAVGPSSHYQIDLTRYYASAGAEATGRAQLQRHVQEFLRVSPAAGAQSLTSWLASFETLLKSVRKHDAYVYLKAERDVGDVQDAQADVAMAALETTLDTRIDVEIARLGRSRLERLLNDSQSLRPFRYLIESSLDRSSHSPSVAQAHAVATIAAPALQALRDSYRSLRRSAIAAAPKIASADREQAFHARWAAVAAHEDAFASQLIGIASIENGIAHARGFSSAADAAYFDQGLATASVQRILSAVRASDAERRYEAVRATEAARRLEIGARSVHVWDLAAADSFSPPAVPFEQAIPLIIAAERPMGATYSSEYVALLEPNNHRVDLCTNSQCDQTGFSEGFAGFASGLYFGGYQETINNVRAVAHEAGHAVHRQFMNEHQPVASYNTGPNYMFESFAIFNELLLWDHLSKAAATNAERAYYLDAFLDDATFQVFGSAEESDLEAHIYTAVQTGNARTAADLDALTSRIFARYTPRLAAEHDVSVYWARDSLYFTDPLYDVNYLYAGLLALCYFDRFERDPSAFATRYVALLENGFTEAPARLERDYLGIDLEDEPGLVREATSLLDARAQSLAKVYVGRAK